MTPELNVHTKAFWSTIGSKKRDYPFWCMTPMHTPRPEHTRGFGHTRIACMYDSNAYWGFKEHDKRNEFMRRYNAMVWSPG